jgi:hypothetical protein
MTASQDTCGAFGLCVWRAVPLLKASGRDTTVFDLCIAIDDEGLPCGRKASHRFGSHDIDKELGDNFHRGQPFCSDHAAQIKSDALIDLEDHARRTGLFHAMAADEHRIQASRQREKNIAAAKARHNKGFVYFARRGDKLKIGTSVNVPKRISGLEFAAGGAFDDVVVTKGGRSREQLYHRRYAQHRLKGEWFNASPDILREMDRLRADQPVVQIA